LSAKETRFEATYRVTAATASWAWCRGSRTIVPEVGLHRARGLCAPNDGRWRLDLVTVVPRHGVSECFDVIEVKGTRADIGREDLGTGKWILRYDRMGLTPWLAIDAKIDDKMFEALHPMWGVMRVSGYSPKVIRQPQDPVWHDIRQSNDDATASHRVLAQIASLQSMPMLMGLKAARRASAMALAVNNPWQKWIDHAPLPRVEGPGNIL